MDKDERYFREPDIVPGIKQKQKERYRESDDDGVFSDEEASDEEAREKEKELPYSDSGEDNFSDQEAMERYCYDSKRKTELSCMAVMECASRPIYGGGYYSHLDRPIQKKKSNCKGIHCNINF